jgi:AraC-like DNA-binding protein
MKILQFTIPSSREKSLVVQEDILPHFYTHFHRHMEMQITWIVNGDGTLLVGNSMQRFQSNDVFIIGANQPHVFKSNPGYSGRRLKKRVHSITIFFNPAGFIRPLLEIPEMKAVKEFIGAMVNSMQSSQANQGVIADYILKVKRNTGGFQLAAFIELLQLLAGFQDWKILSGDSLLFNAMDRAGFRMDDIYRYTMANYAENISIKKIASIICLTPPAFCRYFKKHTQKTYMNFLNEIRIGAACKQMVNGGFNSLSDIAYKNGFNNSVTFNRLFRKLKGCTPREYLREYSRNLGL